MNSKRLRGGLDKVSVQFPLVPNASLAFSLESEEYISFKMQTYGLMIK